MQCTFQKFKARIFPQVQAKVILYPWTSHLRLSQGRKAPSVLAVRVRVPRTRSWTSRSVRGVEISILLPSNQRQHRILHIQKDVLPKP